MLENLFIGSLFLGAVGYLSNRFWNELSAKNAGCSKGCGCEKND
jgi:hypothetical protein